MKNFIRVILLLFAMLGQVVTPGLAAIPTFQSLNSQKALNILVAQHKFAKAFGDVPGIALADKFALNLDVDTGGYELVAAQGGTYSIPTTSETLSIVSDSTDDDVGGTGATSLILTCVDGDGLEVLIQPAMDGTTPVVTTQECRFVNRGAVLASGTGNKNAGNITITNTTSGQVLAYIPAGYSVTQQSQIKIPSNKQYYIDYIVLSVVRTAGGQNPKVRFQGVVYNFTTETEYTIFEYVMDAGVQNSKTLDDFKSQPLLSNEIFFIRASTSNDDTEVFVRMMFETRETSD